jgi:hypothetical protein
VVPILGAITALTVCGVISIRTLDRRIDFETAIRNQSFMDI